MRIKTIIGLFLIVVSVAGMYFWETTFRERIVYTQVLVPCRDIDAKEIVTAKDFKTQNINPQALVEGALTPEQIGSIEGKLCLYPVLINQQLVSDFFKSETVLEIEGCRNYVIPSEWIHSYSKYLNEGDYADFYSLPDKAFLGKYRIDVLETYENEIRMEISASLEDYFNIYEACNAEENLLLITTEKDTWEL